MGQLPLEEKNRISHRSDAARKAVAALQQIAASPSVTEG
jgi:inosine/xanthosine triphosphate pyrophosphatase family protein